MQRFRCEFGGVTVGHSQGMTEDYGLPHTTCHDHTLPLVFFQDSYPQQGKLFSHTEHVDVRRLDGQEDHHRVE